MKSVALSFFLCLFIAVNAQLKSFNQFTIEDGLAGNEVVKSISDTKGFIWIATHNGLSRFDGKYFKNYTFIPNDTTSLRSIWVTDIILDTSGIIWISTEWGVAWYDENFDRFRYIAPKNFLTILYKAPFFIDNKNLWVAAENGLFKIDVISKNIIGTNLIRIADPQCISQTENGDLLIGTRGFGLIDYNPLKNSYQKLAINCILPQAHYISFYKNKNELYAATSEGLLQLSNNNCKLYYKCTGNISSETGNQLMYIMPLDSTSSLLLCSTYDKRLLVFDNVKKVFIRRFTGLNNLPDRVFYHMFQKENYGWWCSQSGFYRINLKEENINFFKIVSKHSNFYRITMQHKLNKQLVWLITDNNKQNIFLYNVITKKIVSESGVHTPFDFNNSKIGAIQNKQGELMVALNRYINIFSASGKWIKEIDVGKFLNSITLDSKENIWLGTEEGLSLYKKDSKSITHFKNNFSGTDIENNSDWQASPSNFIFNKGDTAIWIANGKYGLFSFNTVTKKFTAHRQPSPQLYETLNRTSTLLSYNDTLWNGNMSGLTAFVPDSLKFINLNAKDGLKSTYVYSIQHDGNNNIWGRGNAGVFFYNTSEKNFTNYQLPIEFDANYYRQLIFVADSNCYLGLQDGFAIIKNSSNNKSNNNSFITSFSANGNAKYPLNEDIKLDYDENNIQIDFTAINFEETPLEFIYQLNGLNNNWINLDKKRYVSFTNLPPGKYNFLVKARQPDTKIYGLVANCNFEIKAAFWQTAFFKYILILSGLLLIILWYRNRIKNINKKNEDENKNQKLASMELALLRSQMNPHFIFNSLNSIQKYIWENKEEDAAEYLARFAKLIRAILENSRKELISLKEEIEVMKLYIDLEHRRSNGQFEYVIKIGEKINQQQTMIPPLLLQPFIENAIWHGLNKKQAKGNLLVDIQENASKLICIIDDDGVGRQQIKNETTIEKKSLGIEITQQRINRLMQTTNKSASVLIQDKTNNGVACGTTVTLSLPLQIQS